jgi:hypothetical protein
MSDVIPLKQYAARTDMPMRTTDLGCLISIQEYSLMKRSTSIAAVALSVSVALGFAAPAAVAGPPANHPTHAKAVKTDKAAQPAAQKRRQALRDIARVDARLDRAVRDSRLKRLAAEVQTAVRANVALDHAKLATLTTAVETADSALDLRQVRKELRQTRPQVYTVVINDLRQAARIQARALANDALLAEAPDADAVAANEAAKTAVAEAVALAMKVTATSSKSELRAVHAAVVTARKALGAVADALEADETDETEQVEPTTPEEPAAAPAA